MLEHHYLTTLFEPKSVAVIGASDQENPGRVVLQTAYGTTRIVDMLAGDQLPRIC